MSQIWNAIRKTAVTSTRQMCLVQGILLAAHCVFNSLLTGHEAHCLNVLKHTNTNRFMFLHAFRNVKLEMIVTNFYFVHLSTEC